MAHTTSFCRELEVSNDMHDSYWDEEDGTYKNSDHLVSIREQFSDYNQDSKET